MQKQILIVGIIIITLLVSGCVDSNNQQKEQENKITSMSLIHNHLPLYVGTNVTIQGYVQSLGYSISESCMVYSDTPPFGTCGFMLLSVKEKPIDGWYEITGTVGEYVTGTITVSIKVIEMHPI